MVKRSIVVNFHAVDDHVWMEKILLFLKRSYRIISIEEFDSILNCNGKFSNFCLLTFDDGHISFYDKVFPLLKKYSIPANLFVSPDIITKQENFWFSKVQHYFSEDFKDHLISKTGFSIETNSLIECRSIMKRLRYSDISNIIQSFEKKFKPPTIEYENISIDQIKEIQESGLVNIGAHTLNHPILANEMDEVSKSEIVESIDKLNKILNFQTFTFAYPNGIPELDFGRREKEYLRSRGIRYAFSTRNDFLHSKFDRFSIPRTGLVNETVFRAHMKLLLGPFWDYLKGLKNGESSEKRFRMNSSKESSRKK